MKKNKVLERVTYIDVEYINGTWWVGDRDTRVVFAFKIPKVEEAINTALNEVKRLNYSHLVKICIFDKHNNLENEIVIEPNTIH